VFGTEIIGGLPVKPIVSEQENYHRRSIMAAIGCLHPRSVGTLTLKSKDYKDIPVIDPHYLDIAEDIEIGVAAIIAVRKIMKSSAMSEWVEQEFETFDGTNEEDTHNVLRNYIKDHVASMWHPIGTCKMGDPSDESTVVNPKCQVKNVQNLRVIDASVMPHLTSGNTHAPTMAIGFLAAELILEDLANTMEQEK